MLEVMWIVTWEGTTTGFDTKEKAVEYARAKTIEGTPKYRQPVLIHQESDTCETCGIRGKVNKRYVSYEKDT